MDSFKSDIADVLALEDCSAEFYFLLSNNDTIKVKNIELEDKTQNDLKKVFVTSVFDNILSTDGISLVKLSEADERKDVIYEYDLDEVPVELSQLKQIIENDNFDTFDFSNDSLEDIKGILILLGNHEKQLALYKYQYPIALIKKTSNFILRKSEKNRFEQVGDDILKIFPKFEFIKINGKYYILDLKTLERFFGFHDAIKNVAEVGVEIINESNIVKDISMLSNRLDDITFARKLVRVANSSPVIGTIPNDLILSFSNNHPALKGRFTYSDDGSQFDLSKKTSQVLFLKLLNDDFLQSELTKKYYESMAKDSVETKATA